MAKKFNIKNTKLYKDVQELVTEKMWPFETVTSDEFLKASEQLLKYYHNSDERKIGNKVLSAEAYMDRTTEATIIMMKCIQQLEKETLSKEMDMMLQWHDGIPYDMSFMAMQEFVEYATNEMYEYNNYVCDSLVLDLREHGLAARYIDMESERTYIIDQENTLTLRATKNHYEAMVEAYKQVEDLIQHGLPSERFLGKIRDKILGTKEAKEHNQEIINKILNSEAELDVIVLYVIPEIDLKIKEYYAKGIVEADNEKELENLQPGELRQSDPYFFRREHDMYVIARETIANMIQDMIKKEEELANTHKINVKKDPKTGTYTFSAEWSTGKKDVVEKNTKLKNGSERRSKIVKEKKYRERRIDIKIGQSSHRLYEETKKKSKCYLGYSNKQELTGKRLAIANMVTASVLRQDRILKRKTKVAGKNEFEASYTFKAAEASEKLTYKRIQEDVEHKERTLFGVSTSIGTLSANIDATKVVPVVKGSAQTASASVNVLDVAKANISAYGVSYNSSADIVGQVKEQVFEHVVGDDQTPVLETAQKIAEKSIGKLTKVNVATPKAGISVEAGGITIFSASHDGNEGKVVDRTDEIKDFASDVTDKASDVIEEVKQAIEANETNPQQNVNPEIDAIDMRIFDVQFDRVAVINRQSEQDHGVPGEFEEDIQELFIL